MAAPTLTPTATDAEDPEIVQAREDLESAVAFIEANRPTDLDLARTLWADAQAA